MYNRIDRIAVREIDTKDNTYRISLTGNIETLARSIAEIGLIQPPIVQETAGGYRIVSGFARVGACRQCGMNTIEAKILGADRPPLECQQLAIADNAMNRPLNVWEAAAAAVKLSAYYPSSEAVCRAAGFLGLALSPELLEKHRRLLSLPESVQTAVARGTIALQTALWLERIDADSAVAVVNLFETLRPTFNQQKQMLDMLQDLARSGDIRIHTLLEKPSIADIVSDPDRDRKQKIQTLQAALHHRRYPELSRAENRFYRLKKQLHLPAGVDLIAPRQFESPVYQIHIRFDSASDLNQKLSAMFNLIQTPEFNTVLDRELEDS